MSSLADFRKKVILGVSTTPASKRSSPSLPLPSIGVLDANALPSIKPEDDGRERDEDVTEPIEARIWRPRLRQLDNRLAAHGICTVRRGPADRRANFPNSLPALS